jgi:hypothetical protein
MKNKFEELENVKVVETLPKGRAKTRYNKRLLSKEASVQFFLDNCREAVEKNKDEGNGTYYLPDNIEEIAEELFSMDNVHVAMTPCDDHFNKDGEWVTEEPTHSYRGLDDKDIIKTVKRYLDEGAVVYIYVFYYMKNGVVYQDYVDWDAKCYWWRLIRKKDE